VKHYKSVVLSNFRMSRPLHSRNARLLKTFGHFSEEKLDDFLFSFTAVVQIMQCYQFIISVWHHIG